MNKTSSYKGSSTAHPAMRVLFKFRSSHKRNANISTLEPNINKSATKTEAFLNEQSQPQIAKQQYEAKKRINSQYASSYYHRTPKQRSSRKKTQLSWFNRIKTDHQQKQLELDCLGQKQTTLEKESLDGNKPIDQKVERLQQKLTFEDIQRSLQRLMGKRLNDCLGFNKKSDWNIESQINKLIEAYKEIKMSDNPQQEEGLSFLQRKIAMLQKFMAQKMVESDIAKKYYLSKISNPNRHFKTESLNITNSIAELKQQPIKKHQALILTSKYQESFEGPDRDAYNINKKGPTFFDPNKMMQPLPRSSYNRDFLDYGARPNMESFKPIESAGIKGAISTKVMNTSYQSNFVLKKAERINHKELDACRDKFKNLPIIFGRKDKQLMAYNLAALKSNLSQHSSILKQQRDLQSIQRKESNITKTGPQFKTQASRQFIQGIQLSPSIIKHKNIQKLKYGFKNQLHI